MKIKSYFKYLIFFVLQGCGKKTHFENVVPETDIIKNPSIVYQNSQIFISSKNKAVSLNPKDGKIIWEFETKDRITSSPFCYKERIYIGSFDSNIYCLNAKNGNKIWQFSTNDRVTASPIVINDKVYITSWDGYVYCLSYDNGVIIWKKKSNPKTDYNADIRFNAQYSDKKLFYYDFEGFFYCLDADNGELLWSNNSAKGCYIDNYFINQKNIFFQQSCKGSTQILNISNGKNKTNSNSGLFGSLKLITSDDKILFLNENQLIFYNSTTEAIIWSYNLSNDIKSLRIKENKGINDFTIFESIPIISNEAIIFPYKNAILSLNIKDGKKNWAKIVKNGISFKNNPVVANGEIVVGTGFGGELFCLNEKDGNIKWSIQLPDSQASPCIIDEKNNIYLSNLFNIFQ